MSKVLIIIVITTLLSCLQARVTDVECRKYPTNKRHCDLEYPTYNRLPNTIRYVSNWTGETCVKWRWWSDALCPLPVNDNNFPSERACIDACTGWA